MIDKGNYREEIETAVEDITLEMGIKQQEMGYIDEDGNIWIDGEILEEHYGADPIEYQGLAAEEIVLADDEYFCLGDNRLVSKDSRYSDVGNIKREEIIGRAIFRMWPLSEIGPVGK